MPVTVTNIVLALHKKSDRHERDRSRIVARQSTAVLIDKLLQLLPAYQFGVGEKDCIKRGSSTIRHFVDRLFYKTVSSPFPLSTRGVIYTQEASSHTLPFFEEPVFVGSAPERERKSVAPRMGTSVMDPLFIEGLFV